MTLTIHESDIEFPTEEKLAKMPQAQLIKLLNGCMELTAASLRSASQVVKVLDSRGTDLSEFNQTMLGYLRRISAGQLSTELLVGWRDTAVYGRARRLPLPLQEAVVSNAPIRVVTLKDGGKAEEWLCEPRNMTTAIAKQVFAADHIRSESEQIAYIRSAQAQAPEHKPDPLPYVVKGQAVEFTRPCRMTKRDLQRLLKGMD